MKLPTDGTPLHLACRSSGSVSHLLPSPSLNAPDHNGFTPLDHARNLGNTAAAAELLEQGGGDIRVPDKDGLTSFHVACYSEHIGVEIVGMLLEREGGLREMRDS